MPDPVAFQDGHPDPWLTSIALAWGESNAGLYVARNIFPQVPTPTSHGTYKVWGRSYFLQDNVGPRPLGGYPRQVGYKTGTKTFSIDEQALEAVIDDRERPDLNWTGDDVEANKIRLLMSQHLVHADRQWAAAYFHTGVWGRDVTGVASGPTTNQFLQWDNANSNPLLTVASLRATIGDKVSDQWLPNKLVLGRNVFLWLCNHPLILARLGVNADRILQKDDLARFFGLDPGNILVPGGIVNTGPEKETFAATEAAAVYTRIVGVNDALRAYATDTPSREMPSAGYTFAWNGYLGADASNPLAGVTRGRDERAYTDWFHLRTAYDMEIVAPELGVFLSAAVSGPPAL